MTVTQASPSRTPVWDWFFWAGLVCWGVGFAWYWWRPPSLWLLDLVIVPVAELTYWFGFVSVIVAVLGGRRWRELAVVVPVMVVAAVLVNPGYRMAPQTWFMMHRPLYNLALNVEPGNDYYGRTLPPSLRFLSSEGRVSDQDGVRFFPQWLGIPDDAGGYLYSQGGPPAGIDMYGMACKDPVDLGGGWWMCGMNGSGL